MSHKFFDEMRSWKFWGPKKSCISWIMLYFLFTVFTLQSNLIAAENPVFAHLRWCRSVLRVWPLNHHCWMCLQVQWSTLLTTPTKDDGCGQRWNRLVKQCISVWCSVTFKAVVDESQMGGKPQYYLSVNHSTKVEVVHWLLGPNDSQYILSRLESCSKIRITTFRLALQG